MQHQAPFARVPHAPHGPHAVGEAWVKHREAVEERRDCVQDLIPLDHRLRIEVAPIIEDLRLEDLGLSSFELPPLPLREGEHKRPRPVRDVGVQLLPAPIHIVAQPNGRDAAAAELLLPVLEQGLLKLRPLGGGEVLLRGGSDQGVLPWYVPVVPHEAFPFGDPGVLEVAVKDAPELLGAGVKVVCNVEELRDWIIDLHLVVLLILYPLLRCRAAKGRGAPHPGEGAWVEGPAPEGPVPSAARPPEPGCRAHCPPQEGWGFKGRAGWRAQSPCRPYRWH
mmetsp:Transcript_43878/g.139834  ORF Transcript_43878/g.139834 Transcript_43878/m.139834 type:complete len:279 (+) Transcript_43878:616-1452(+)